MNASFSEVVIYLSKRDGSTEQKTALGKGKLQQASSTVKNKLLKEMHVTLDPGCSGGSQNLVKNMR
jgi:hypothetical protein